MKVEDFINLIQDNVSVEDHSLKFTLLSKYALSLVSNPKDEMNTFVTGIADLLKDECRTTMLHNDMNISRLMVYAQYIEESKLSRITRNLKRARSDDKTQPRFRKRHPNQHSPSAPKYNYERGGGAQGVKPTFSNCGKKHFGKCLSGTRGFYGCVTDDKKVKYFHTISSK